MANQKRGDMRMYDKLFEMVRGTGDAGLGVAGVDLARAMPRALETNIREALAVLEEETELMVDGPNVGLDGVTVYDLKTATRVTPGKGGGRSGKRHAVRPLMRGAGSQRAIYGDNYTVEWGKQKRGKESRGDDNVGGGRGSRGSAKAAADEEPASGQGGEDAADMDRGVVSIL